LNLSRNLPQFSQFRDFFDKNENIKEHSICNFSTNFLEGREIAQGGGKIFPKCSPNFYENFMSSNFTKTAALSTSPILGELCFHLVPSNETVILFSSTSPTTLQ